MLLPALLTQDAWRFVFIAEGRPRSAANEYFPYAGEVVPDQGRWPVYGLDLDEWVLEALYAGNARRIVPGLR